MSGAEEKLLKVEQEISEIESPELRKLANTFKNMFFYYNQAIEEKLDKSIKDQDTKISNVRKFLYGVISTIVALCITYFIKVENVSARYNEHEKNHKIIVKDDITDFKKTVKKWIREND